MPHPNRPRPSQLHHHQTHGAEPDAQSARQGLLTTQAKGRRMGRGLPRQPHRSVICSPDCPAFIPAWNDDGHLSGWLSVGKAAALAHFARDCVRELERHPNLTVVVEGEADTITDAVKVSRLTCSQCGEDIVASAIEAAIRRALQLWGAA